MGQISKLLYFCVLTSIALATAFVGFSYLPSGLAPAQANSAYTYYFPLVFQSAWRYGAGDAQFGAAFISSVEIAEQNSGAIPSSRYTAAVNAGAAWNRWPLYWNNIETSNNSFGYQEQDAVINSDLARGLKVDAILLGTPSWASSVGTTALAVEAAPPLVGQGPRFMGPVPDPTGQTGLAATSSSNPYIAPPKNLSTWIFQDGDTPGPNKQINQDNYWARFVYNTVSRYKGKVAAWEIWNEEDLLDGSGQPVFWSGSIAQYFRLLKVGYIAAKYADPNAKVVMGGLMYWSQPTFLPQLLRAMQSDSAAAANNYYFDVSAWHWYSRSSQMYDRVNATRATLQSFGLGDKPIWVNETGVPIWNDPAIKPFGWTTNRPYYGSATQDEAASYVIQSAAYGLAAGVQETFHFQLYDDGNAEAFGLLRNDNSLRPSYTAYQVATRYLTGFSNVRRATDGNVEKIIFTSNASRQSVIALWDNAPGGLTYSVSAATGTTQAYLVDKAGRVTVLTPAKSYSIFLPGATDNNGQSSSDYIVGGSPYLLVQQ